MNELRHYDKWDVSKLTSILVQDETRLKSQMVHFFHLLGHQETEKNSKEKGGRSKKNSLHNLNGSSKVVPKRDTWEC